MTTAPRFRCRYCEAVLPAWYAVPGEPNGAMLLHHVAQAHPAALTPFLDQMHVTDDITPAIVQAFEAVESESHEEQGPGAEGRGESGAARVF